MAANTRRLQITWTEEETELVQWFVDTIVAQWLKDHPEWVAENPGADPDVESILQVVASQAIVERAMEIDGVDVAAEVRELEMSRRSVPAAKAEAALSVLVPPPPEPEPNQPRSMR